MFHIGKNIKGESGSKLTTHMLPKCWFSWLNMQLTKIDFSIWTKWTSQQDTKSNNGAQDDEQHNVAFTQWNHRKKKQENTWYT